MIEQFMYLIMEMYLRERLCSYCASSYIYVHTSYNKLKFLIQLKDKHNKK